MECNIMRELNVNEIEQVNGGIVPIVGFVAAMGGHMMARSMAGYVISRVSTVTAAYGLAEYFKNP